MTEAARLALHFVAVQVFCTFPSLSISLGMAPERRWEDSQKHSSNLPRENPTWLDHSSKSLFVLGPDGPYPAKS